MGRSILHRKKFQNRNRELYPEHDHLVSAAFHTAPPPEGDAIPFNPDQQYTREDHDRRSDVQKLVDRVTALEAREAAAISAREVVETPAESQEVQP